MASLLGFCAKNRLNMEMNYQKYIWGKFLNYFFNNKIAITANLITTKYLCYFELKMFLKKGYQGSHGPGISRPENTSIPVFPYFDINTSIPILPC